MINPNAVHKFEPYISYSEYKSQIVQVGSGANAKLYGDTTNFVGTNQLKAGQDRSSLGKIKQVGINNDTVTLQFQWIF